MPDPASPDLGAVVAGVQRRLAEAGLPSPAADAHALVAHVLDADRRELSRRIVLREQLDDDALARLAALVERREGREPLQHLTGMAGFRTIEILVGPGVFVPRPETELSAGLAVLAAQGLVEEGARPLVVDLCTGSGAIALSVAAEVPRARVVAVELSGEAVAWARRSAAHLGLPVEIREGDATDPAGVADLAGTVDLVVANPPYIPPDAEPLEPEVRDHDPAMALFGGGTDGLEIPRGVVAVAAGLLRPGGLFVMEHGASQGEATRALVADELWRDAVTHRDLAGRDRALVATRTPLRGDGVHDHGGGGRVARPEVQDSAP